LISRPGSPTRTIFVPLLATVLAASVSAAEIRIPADFDRVQEAIESALEGDVIVVSPGIYPGAIDFRGKAIHVRSESGPAATVLDGMGVAPVVTFQSGERGGSVLEGFTLQNGYAAGGSGGGVRCFASSPRVVGNVIRGCSADLYGGGVYLEACRADLAGNTVRDNLSYDGGGVATLGSQASLRDNRIRDNLAVLTGGGLLAVGSDASELSGGEIAGNRALLGAGAFLFESATSIERCRIEHNTCVGPGGGGLVVQRATGTVRLTGNLLRGNQTGGYGGGAAFFDSRAVIAGNLVADNAAGSDGGGLLLQNGDYVLASNTVARNRGGRGGGIFQDVGVTVELWNTIVWDNAAPQGGQLFVGPDAELQATACIVEGGFPGEGILEADPLFVNAGRGDYHLRLGTPARDVASDHAPEIPTVDLDDDLRPLGALDIGVDELRAEIAARYGTVGSGGGSVFDVLRLNGGPGDARREVRVLPGERVVVSLDPSPAGPSPARFVLYAWIDVPDPMTLRPQPFGVGTTGFPTPLDEEPVNRPIAVWNNLGHFVRLGLPTRPSSPAPTVVVDRHASHRHPGVVTVQGFLQDRDSCGAVPVSVTNAVVLRIRDDENR